MNRSRRRLFGRLHRAGIAVVLLMLDASGAFGQSAPSADTVILLQPTTASLAFRRSLARIRDELSADRFHVVVADSNVPGDPGGVIDNAARDTEGGTVVALFGDPETGQAELCVVQRASRRAAVRRASVVVDDPERMPEALATRALELLRATALELAIDIERERRPQASPEPRADLGVAPRPLPSAPLTETAMVSVDMGVGMWSSIEGPPPAVAPVGRVAVRLSEWARVRASVAGLGSRPRVETAYGSATLSQTMVLAELAAVFRHDKRIRPTLSLGAGVLNVAVSGTGAGPYEGREPQQWCAAFDGGVGVAFAVSSRAALVTELHALVATPHPVVRFADTRAATIGFPSLMVTLALQVAP